MTGEACIPPKKYKTFKIFEPHLEPANGTAHPCAAAGYSQYVKTVTHGIPGILSVTLDMYHKPSVSDSAIPSGCFEKHRTRASCDADAACSWCRGYEGHPSCAAWPGSLPPWQKRTCDKYKPTQAPLAGNNAVPAGCEAGSAGAKQCAAKNATCCCDPTHSPGCCCDPGRGCDPYAPEGFCGDPPSCPSSGTAKCGVNPCCCTKWEGVAPDAKCVEHVCCDVPEFGCSAFGGCCVPPGSSSCYQPQGFPAVLNSYT